MTEEEYRKICFKAFSALRGEIINRYSEIEFYMVLIVSRLFSDGYSEIDVEKDKKYIEMAHVFCNTIISSRAKNSVIFELCKIKFDNISHTFIESLESKLKKIDSDRNRIIHYMALQSHRGGETFDPFLDLSLRNHLEIGNDTRKIIRVRDMCEIKKKMEFISNVLFYFQIYLRKIEIPVGPDKNPWSEVFSQKCLFPPEESHPLYEVYNRNYMPEEFNREVYNVSPKDS